VHAPAAREHVLRADRALHGVRAAVRGLDDEGVLRRAPQRDRGVGEGRRLRLVRDVLADGAAADDAGPRQHRAADVHLRLERVLVCVDLCAAGSLHHPGAALFVLQRGGGAPMGPAGGALGRGHRADRRLLFRNPALPDPRHDIRRCEAVAVLRVVVAGVSFPSLEPEREVLARVGADVAQAHDAVEALALAPEADALLTDYFRVAADVVSELRRCRVVCQYGVGLDGIDVEAATAAGILVTHTPAYCVDELADHALALVLAVARKVALYDRSVREGHWDYNVG